MIGILRFIGIVNAAVWFGSAVFLTIGLPAVFSQELRRRLTDPGVGFAAEALVGQFFKVQYCCGGIALALALTQWLYLGRASVRRWTVALAAALLTVALAGGLWAQPKMADLHVVKYFARTPEQRTEAGREFALWHGASESVNIAVLAGLLIYLWQVSAPQDGARFGSFTKIRG